MITSKYCQLINNKVDARLEMSLDAARFSLCLMTTFNVRSRNHATLLISFADYNKQAIIDISLSDIECIKDGAADKLDEAILRSNDHKAKKPSGIRS